MSDTPPGQPPSSPIPGATGQPRVTGVPLAVRAQYLKDLSFENPRSPQALGLREQPDIKLQIEVNVSPVGADQEVVLTLNVTANTKSGEPLFVVECSYAGLFGVGQLQPQLVVPLLHVECPRLLFPFARAIVAAATRDGGFPPLLLAPVDFVSLYQQRAAAARGAVPAPAAPTTN
jgi:preprotein translocase subunit SecB